MSLKNLIDMAKDQCPHCGYYCHGKSAFCKKGLDVKKFSKPHCTEEILTFQPFHIDFNFDEMCRVGEDMGFIEFHNSLGEIFTEKFRDELFRRLSIHYDRVYLKKK